MSKEHEQNILISSNLAEIPSTLLVPSLPVPESSISPVLLPGTILGYVGTETFITGNDQNNINSDTTVNDSDTSREPLSTKLQKWVAIFHVSHNCLNYLLTILRSENINLPKNARTLLKTPKSKDHAIVSVPQGHIFI